MDVPPLYPVAQEECLELPLGYAADPPAPSRPIAVVLHAYHIDLLPEFHRALSHIPYTADLFVSTDTEAKREAAAACFADWPRGMVDIRVMPNRGRDIAPKLVGFADIHQRADYVLHLHTKLSPHASGLAGWRGYALDTLLGSPATVRSVFEAFARAPRLGMLAPQHPEALRPWIGWGDNHAAAEALAARMGFALPTDAPLDFPSGSMFWARSAALRPLLDLGLGFDSFPDECGQTDGTLAHAIERLFYHGCEQAGFDWFKVTAPGALEDQRHVTAAYTPESLADLLSARPLRLAARRSGAFGCRASSRTARGYAAMRGLDVVVPVMSVVDATPLRRCIASLVGQAGPAEGTPGFGGPLRVHLMLNQFSIDDLRRLRESLTVAVPRDDTAELTFHNWTAPAPPDVSAPLLNWGLDIAKARYVSCVGPHVIVMRRAFAALLKRLRSQGAALALGGCVEQRDAPGTTSKFFLIDRSLISPQDLVFQAADGRDPVDAFIGRIGFRYGTDRACVRDVLAVHDGRA